MNQHKLKSIGVFLSEERMVRMDRGELLDNHRLIKSLIKRNPLKEKIMDEVKQLGKLNRRIKLLMKELNDWSLNQRLHSKRKSKYMVINGMSMMRIREKETYDYIKTKICDEIEFLKQIKENCGEIISFYQEEKQKYLDIKHRLMVEVGKRDEIRQKWRKRWRRKFSRTFILPIHLWLCGYKYELMEVQK